MNQAIYFVTSLVTQAILISCGMIHAGILVEEHFTQNYQEIDIFAFIDVIQQKLFTLMELVQIIAQFLINIDFNGAHTSAIIHVFMGGLYIGMVLAKQIAIIP